MSTRQIASFSISPEIRSVIDNSSAESGQSRSRWLETLVSQYADEWTAVQRQVKVTIAVGPYVKQVRAHCKNMYTGKEAIRDWDDEIMGLLEAARAIGVEKSPDDIYLFDQMVERLVGKIQQAQARNWAREKPTVDL